MDTWTLNWIRESFKVVCISLPIWTNNQRYDIGKIYDAQYHMFSGNPNLDVRGNDNVVRITSKEHFKLLDEFRNNKIESIIK